MISFRNLAGLSFLILFLHLGYYSTIFAGTVSTVIKYVTETHVYLDAGSNSGIEKGDTGVIQKGGDTLAQFEVEFVAANSASCKITSGSYTQLSPGLAVIVTTAEKLLQFEPDSAIVESIVLPNAPPVGLAGSGKKSAAVQPRLLGRVGVQYYFQDDLDELNYDYHQPSVYLNLVLADIVSPGYSLKLRIRSRQTSQRMDTANLLNDSWDNRLYELSFNYDDPDSRISYSAGRVLSRSISGMGYLDGIVLDYQLDQNSSFGILGGSTPDPSTSGLNTEVTKSGVFYRYEHGGWQSNRFAGTIALAGQYAFGQIDREYLYQQLDFNYGRKFSIYQSSEINFNRGWRKQANDSRLQLTGLVIHARYNPTNSVGVSAGYDNRQNSYTYYNRSTPDSLFDDRLRQGYKAGLNLKISRDFRLNLNSAFRTVSDRSSSQFYSSAASYSNFLSTGITLGYRVALYNNNYNRGIQNSLIFSKNILRQDNLVVSFGNNNYHYTGLPQNSGFNWLRIDNYYYFSRKIYFAGSVEIQRGDEQNSNRFYLDLGFRL